MSLVLDGSAGITTNAGTVVSSTDATIHGLTIGQGAGSVSTNTAVGVSALQANTSGASSTAVGYQALYSNLDAGSSTALGYQSLYTSNSSGCTSVGYQSGYSNTSGSVTSFGYRANYSNTTGSSNTAIGQSALYANTTGGSNTAIGYQAGNVITTGSNITCIGYNTQPSGATDTNELVIATGTSTGKGSNTGFLNNNFGGTYQGNNSTVWSVTSDQRLKKNIVDNTVGLSAITQIKVRNFEYRLVDEITELDKSNVVGVQGIQLGPIAQELAEVLPDCVKTESTGVMSVDASDVMWHMVNAIKELNALVTAQAIEIAALKAKVGV